jgi:hypothetical protein
MLRMVNLFIALSLGVQREQLLHLIGLTWPRPFLFRPLSKSSVLALLEYILMCWDRCILGRSLLYHLKRFCRGKSQQSNKYQRFELLGNVLKLYIVQICFVS